MKGAYKRKQTNKEHEDPETKAIVRNKKHQLGSTHFLMDVLMAQQESRRTNGLKGENLAGIPIEKGDVRPIPGRMVCVQNLVE